MRTIFSAFPGTGKTEFCKQNKTVHDSDSSSFSWLSPGVRDPEFPQNYIKHIQTLEGIVLVSSHIQVREALADAKLDYVLVYPSIECKEEYLERYKQRGSPAPFIELMAANWSNWVAALVHDDLASDHIVLEAGEYLSKVFDCEYSFLLPKSPSGETPSAKISPALEETLAKPTAQYIPFDPN